MNDDADIMKEAFARHLHDGAFRAKADAVVEASEYPLATVITVLHQADSMPVSGTPEEAALAVLRAQSPDPRLLRWCRWPDCWNHFDVMRERETSGGTWMRHRQDLACPDHGSLGHWPTWTMSEDRKSITGRCLCGAQKDINTGLFHEAERWWDEHAREIERQRSETADGATSTNPKETR